MTWGCALCLSLVVWATLVTATHYVWPLAFLGLGVLAVHITDWALKGLNNLTNKAILSQGHTRDKAVLITGCDTGFGHMLAERLDHLGFKVYAGCLNPNGEGPLRLKAGASYDLKTIKLDVTKDSDVRAAYDFVQTDIGNSKLWAVVNNAGIGEISEIEWCSMSTYQRVLDINTLGPIRITKAFLPLLRDYNGGRVVIVASLAARYTFAGFSAYSMSKHAAVSFADALRLEMNKWNISVHTVEPTLYRTQIASESYYMKALNQTWENLSEDIRNSYGNEYLKDYKSFIHEHLNRALPTEKIAEVVDDMVHAVAGIQPKSRYVPNIKTQIRARILGMLPTDLVDDIMLRDLPSTPPADIERRKSQHLIDPRIGPGGQRLKRIFSMPSLQIKRSPSPKIGDFFTFPIVKENLEE
ncbi:unnamed protein product [Meganyctiphanes norvegica]|uniref:Uncharacterized protein n=1 Tax=Meganyctiphanes norvegica TaxID=48144 RepID=A0AAV2Q6K3_MEGNR